jgi:hypothetical protein
MIVRSARIPQGAAGSFSGWYTHVRGALVGRRQALRILVFGPERSKIETAQSQTTEWPT